MRNENGKLIGTDNGKWIWILMDEQTDFIMEMKMDTLMENEFGKRFDYNEWLKWWVRLTTSEQTLNNGEKFNLITKNEFNI